MKFLKFNHKFINISLINHIEEDSSYIKEDDCNIYIIKISMNNGCVFNEQIFCEEEFDKRLKEIIHIINDKKLEDNLI